MRKEYEKMLATIARKPWDYDKQKKAIALATPIIDKFESRVRGKRGVAEKRASFISHMEILLQGGIPAMRKSSALTPAESHKSRLWHWKKASGLELARKAGQYYDEHRNYTSRGDYLHTSSLDFVSPWEGSDKAPYHDMGGEGLALIVVDRTRYYSKSSRWRPCTNETRYLIGKNEAGTYFAHPVPRSIRTVAEACQWIWNGQADSIISRQGDIALIWGKGIKIPSLPRGHKVEGEYVVHETHPAIPVPQKGQRIIVGRRASAQVSQATRD